jgi:hypothetical protein
MKLKTKILLKFGVVALLLSGAEANAQARVILNDAVRMPMDGGVFIVIDNPATNAITKTGSQTGTIISEDEDNKVRWNIGTATGSYEVPFGDDVSSSGQEIPITMNITSAGTGAGRVDFSVYETPDGASDHENSPLPSMVTHLLDAATGTVNNQEYVIDRFFLIDANNYTVKPDVDLTLVYVNSAAEIGSNNLLTEANLVAQRFDDGNSHWDGSPSNSSLFFGSATPASRSVGPFSVGAADFFAAWTLVDNMFLLPIELTSFTGKCVSGEVELKWTTATETENNFFTIEKSMDGTNFIAIAEIQGAGTSNSPIDYTDLDSNPYSGITYYRLKQTDFDGTYTYSDIIAVNNCGTNLNDIYVYGNENNFTVYVHADASTDYGMKITDLSGRQVVSTTQLNVQKGDNAFNFNTSDLAFGIYMVVIENEFERHTEKLILR